jgi:pimeloyl-[acyl-carrier protein] methyl ester esterase
MTGALHIEIRGRGDAHVVMLHGWAMSSAVFAPLVERLEDACTLHLVDLPGHGASRDSAIPLELDACARAIGRATPPALWFGWSLGGLVALHAAVHLKQQVRALAMLCASPRFVRGEGWPHAISSEILRQFAADLRSDYRVTLERFLALEALGSDCAQEDLRRLRRDALQHHAPDVRALCDGLDVLEHADLRAQLHGLQLPNVWIAGRRDRLVPWPAMQWSARQCDGAYVRIEGGGHAPFIGHADEVAHALRQLIDLLPGADRTQAARSS